MLYTASWSSRLETASADSSATAHRDSTYRLTAHGQRVGHTRQDARRLLFITACQRERRLLALLTVVLMASSAEAQPVRVVDGRPLCPTCTVVVGIGPRLGDREGSGALVAEPSSIARDRSGRFYVTQFGNTGMPLVFDSTGHFLQPLGRHGQGPGEFQSPRYLGVSASDTVFVADPVAGRLSVFDPDFRYSRSASDRGLALAYPLVVLAGGSVVAGADVPARNRIGYPLHLYDTTLDFVRSFGADTPVFRPDRRMHSRRRLARASGGGVWASRVNEYSIERFDANGARTLRLIRQAPWFAPHDAPALNVDPEPKPLIMAISEDEQGRLWVLLVVKDERWRTALGTTLPGRLGGGQSAMPVVVDEDRYYDTIVEVIDVAQGRLVVSQRLPQAILFMPSPEVVGTRREDQTGAFYIQTWSLLIRGE